MKKNLKKELKEKLEVLKVLKNLKAFSKKYLIYDYLRLEAVKDFKKTLKKYNTV